MVKIKLFILLPCIAMVSSVIAANQIRATVAPAGAIRTGEQITIPITVDLGVLPEKLGSFTASLSWNTSALQFVSGGGAAAFKNPVINDNHVADGRITLAAVNAQGASGQVQLATLQFEVIGAAGSSIDMELQFTAMAGAGTFNDLMPYLNTETSTIQVASALPTDYSLSQNHPNPFNPTTRIQYALPEDAHVRIQVYNLLGESVRTLVNQKQEAGDFDVIWDSRNDAGVEVPAGVYIYRIKAGPFTDIKKMLLVK